VQNLTRLPKETLVAAAIAAFCGKFPEDERRKMLSQWHPIVGQPADAQFSLSHFLYTENELLGLRGCLGGDSLSLENAAIIANATAVPLIIDPTATAVDWLKDYFERDGKEATILPRGHDRFSSELALAVRFGKILVITEIDTVDEIRMPLVRKDFVFSGARPAVRVGYRDIEYNESFRLYLVTREPQPQLHPTAVANLAIVNFSVTRSCLESMLLSLTLERASGDSTRTITVDYQLRGNKDGSGAT
jgi:dynein heavy chain 2